MPRLLPRLLPILAVLVAALATPPATASAQGRPLSFVDGIDLPVVQDPQLSPDGTQVLFVVDRPDWKANRRVGHVYRIGVDGTGQVQLTAGERGESSPRWSPDGRRIAVLARRDGDEHDQVYVLDAAGGEARRVTTHPTAPRSLTWSKDGTLLFFVAADARSPEQKEKQKLQDDVVAFEETDFDQHHLWVTDLDGKTTQVTIGNYSVTDYSLSPDGSKVVMLRAPSPLLEHSRFVRGVGDGRQRRQRAPADHQRDPRTEPGAVAGQPHGAVHRAPPTRRSTPTTTTRSSWCRQPAAPRACSRPNAPFQVERAAWAPTAAPSTPPRITACTSSSCASTRRPARSR